MRFRFDETVKRFRLYFDEDGATGGDNGGGENSGGADGGEKTYTQAEIDALLKAKDDAFDKKFAAKFAEYEKKKAKEVSEAAKLAAMTEQEKAEHELSQLKEEVNGLKREKTVSEMRSAARGILQGAGVNIPDSIVNALTADDAETTQANVKAFIDVYKKAVQDEVKRQLAKAGTPKVGSKAGGTGMTKEEILKIEDPIKRQKMIKQNMHLFR